MVRLVEWSLPFSASFSFTPSFFSPMKTSSFLFSLIEISSAFSIVSFCIFDWFIAFSTTLDPDLLWPQSIQNVILNLLIFRYSQLPLWLVSRRLLSSWERALSDFCLEYHSLFQHTPFLFQFSDLFLSLFNFHPQTFSLLHSPIDPLLVPKVEKLWSFREFLHYFFSFVIGVVTNTRVYLSYCYMPPQLRVALHWYPQLRTQLSTFTEWKAKAWIVHAMAKLLLRIWNLKWAH